MTINLFHNILDEEEVAEFQIEMLEELVQVEDQEERVEITTISVNGEEANEVAGVIMMDTALWEEGTVGEGDSEDPAASTTPLKNSEFEQIIPCVLLSKVAVTAS